MENFETETCSRCCGTGRYSYCQMYGDTCFKCHGKGKGKVYSKRGEAAIAYMRGLRTVPNTSVQPGWLIYDAGGPFGKAGWKTVVAVKTSGSKWLDNATGEWKHYLDIETKDITFSVIPGNDAMAVASKNRLAETRDEAIRYQATLTKKGTVAKRSAA